MRQDELVQDPESVLPVEEYGLQGAGLVLLAHRGHLEKQERAANSDWTRKFAAAFHLLGNCYLQYYSTSTYIGSTVRRTLEQKKTSNFFFLIDLKTGMLNHMIRIISCAVIAPSFWLLCQAYQQFTGEEGGGHIRPTLLTSKASLENE